MKCIDAIEGTAKYIIKELHTTHIQSGARADDSEYIYHVKTVITATDQYVRDHPELIEDPQLLQHVLYDYSRNLWLQSQEPVPTHSDTTTGGVDSANEEYQIYYFDFIYNRGFYPE